ncbi:Proteasome subunit YC7alpha/Y8 (protease yscE subunit 7) [Orobanche minor]
MSLVRSTFSSDNSREITYTSKSYSSDSYDTKYLLDSPSQEFIHTSASDVSGNSCHPPRLSSYQLTPGVTSLDAHQFKGPIDYDEGKVRLKLQELEKALLDDNSYSQIYGMDIDDEWHDVTYRESPKESSSSNSNFSTTDKIPSTANLTSKSLLFECANSIHNGKYEEALQIINVLRNRVSIMGEPSERIAGYMVEALAARVAISGKGLYKALKCKEQPSSDRLSAMQVLFEVCPCFRFGFMAANGAILEASKEENRVHIIDFDINQGSQYYTLLQTLAKTPGKRAHIRLTGVDDPESVQRPIGGLKTIGLRLEQLAKDLNISFEFRAVASETALVSQSTLGCQPGEALIVNFAFQLHHMPDESVSTLNLRDQLLRMVKSLNPKLVTVVEQEVNTNTAPFLSRFAEVYGYYSAVFESLDATLTRDSQDRVNVERQCLARDIINVVACEGEERIERYEVAGKWRVRMSMAGFRSCQISLDVKDEIEKLMGSYSDRFNVGEEMGALHFGWEDKILIVCSAWR